jgi:hypothetical protein
MSMNVRGFSAVDREDEGRGVDMREVMLGCMYAPILSEPAGTKLAV